MSRAAAYEERFCMFLDVLGFQSHIEETIRPTATFNRMDFSRLLGVLESISRGVNYQQVIVDKKTRKRPSSRRVTQFSDSVVISYLKNEKQGVSEILYDVLQLQLLLAHRGILIRGAITCGKLHHDKQFVFGPALNEAVELERLAMYPRVIVDMEVLSLAGIRKPDNPNEKPHDSRTTASLLEQDLDGMFYIDYFAVHPDDFNEDWGELCEYLLSLRELIRRMSQRKTASIRLKYSWMRQKFNRLARPLERSDFREYLGRYIPDEEEDHFLSVIPFK